MTSTWSSIKALVRMEKTNRWITRPRIFLYRFKCVSHQWEVFKRNLVQFSYRSTNFSIISQVWFAQCVSSIQLDNEYVDKHCSLFFFFLLRHHETSNLKSFKDKIYHFNFSISIFQIKVLAFFSNWVVFQISMVVSIKEQSKFQSIQMTLINEFF